METKFVSAKKIIKNKQIMPREEIDQKYVNELFEDLELGADFPPVHLFQEGDKYILSDGYHRLEAAIKAGYENIKSVIHYGDRRSALLFACGANANHGKRRTNEDKRKAVKNILKAPECRIWGDGLIALHCLVTAPFVGTVRDELTQNGFKSPTERLGVDGRIINTERIGKQKSLDHNSSLSTMVKRPLPVNNPPENNSNSGKAKTKTNEQKSQKPKPKKGRPKSINVSESDKSEVRNQISKMTDGLKKLDSMLENNKSWTKDKAKRLLKISEENELRLTGITRFVQTLNDKISD
jgi:uncharacterized ParB-like nuclease family protein